MRLLIIVGPNQYNVLDYFASQLASGFEKHGWRTTLFSTSFQNKIEFQPRLYDLVISPNGTASMVRLGKELLFDKMELPQIAWMVDHPVNAYPRLQIGAKRSLHTLVDADHLNAARSLVGEGYPLHFCPLAAAEEEWEEGERPIDLLHCGSYRTAAEFAYPDFCDAIAVELRGEPRPVEEVVGEWLGRPIDWHSVADLQFASGVDVYLRARRRDLILESFAKEGMVVDLYGRGWERSPHAKWHRIHEPVAMGEIAKLTGQARCVLDTPIHVGYGPHDRTLAAPLAGALPITYWNRYYQERFVEGEELIGYRWSEVDQLPERIGSLLANERRRIEIVRAGEAKVKKGELWSHRAEQLIQIFEGWCQ